MIYLCKAIQFIEGILRDESILKEEDRIRMFCEKTGRSRAD